jgi:hypothetical protein
VRTEVARNILDRTLRVYSGMICRSTCTLKFETPELRVNGIDVPMLTFSASFRYMGRDTASCGAMNPGYKPKCRVAHLTP